MRGRRPDGPEFVDKLEGSDTTKERAKVILETISGTCRVQEACERLGISEQRFHQLREEMMTGAIKAIEPGHAGRPAQTLTPAEKEVVALKQKIADLEVELRTAKARAEIAVIMPDLSHPSPSAGEDEPEKKTPPRRRRRRGRKKNV
jgi:hypothetical protein